jgi:anti-sigma regulatory factor (Ser/Thr protein kinase)
MSSGHVLSFSATHAGFERGFADLREFLGRHPLEDRVRYFCELTFEEIVTNIMKYGYADDREHGIAVSLDVRHDAIVMTFEDDGVAFNPLEHPEPAHPNTAIGGRGLVLLRIAARDIDYERTPDGRNRLEVTVGPRDGLPPGPAAASYSTKR